MEIIKRYRLNRKIIGYITCENAEKYCFNTGKPSDASCLSWTYKTLKQAEATATEFFERAKNRDF